MHAALVGALAGPELGAVGAGEGTGIEHRVGDTRGVYEGVLGSALGGHRRGHQYELGG